MPARFVVLPELPFTPGSEIDRKAPPGLGNLEAPVEEAVEYVAPAMRPRPRPRRSGPACSASIASAWRTSFFHLGGNSLLAVKPLAHADADLHVRSARSVTCSSTARSARSRRGSARRRLASTPGSRIPRHLQRERLFLLDQLGQEHHGYNLAAAIRMEARWTSPRSRRRSPRSPGGTRCSPRATSSRTACPRRRSSRSRSICGPVDLRALAEPERGRRVTALGREAVKQPFNLAEDPPLQVKLCARRRAPRLLLTLHPSRWTAGRSAILVRDISALYAAGGEPARAALPTLPMQYADSPVAAGVARRRPPHRGARVLEAGARGLPVSPARSPPTGRGRSAPRPRAPVLVPLPRAPDHASTAGRARALDLFMTLLSGMGVLLGRYSGESRVVVGAAVANRIIPEIESLVGFFVNSLALPVDLTRDPRRRAPRARAPN